MNQNSFAKEVLIRARELYAANPDHSPVMATAQMEGECVVTAINVAYQELGDPADWNRDAVAVFRDVVRPYGVVDYNATHSTEEVLVKFDEAIASC